jgi:flavorubredoxin
MGVGMGIALGSILLVLMIATVWIRHRINRETVRAMKTLNPGGNEGTALLVYQPGLSDFQEKISEAFAEGLTSGGWRVEMTTASVQSPDNLIPYQLLVIGSPIYASAVAPPVQRYLHRLGDLHEKRAVLLLTGAGDSQKAEVATENLVATAHGHIVKTLRFFTMKPNREDKAVQGRENRALALEMARQAGRELALEGKVNAHA